MAVESNDMMAIMSLVGTVGIMTKLGASRPIDHSIHGMERHVYLLHSVQMGSRAQPVFYPMRTRDLSPGSKQQRREADHSPPSSARLRMVELYLHSHVCSHVSA
jgi:hypothetical protein